MHCDVLTHAHLLQALPHTGLCHLVPGAGGRHGSPWHGSGHAPLVILSKTQNAWSMPSKFVFEPYHSDLQINGGQLNSPE